MRDLTVLKLFGKEN